MISPRKQFLLVLGFVFAGMVGLAVLGWRSSPPAPKLSLSLNGFTNQDWVRLCYRIPSGSDHSVALFQLDNKTDETLFYLHGRIQLHTKTGWSDDPNWDVPSVSRSRTIGPGQSVAISFPVPCGVCNWRCSVRLIKVERLRRPSWRAKCLAVLHRAGINVASEGWEIWSREIARENAA
jgi:hypothetical protein